MPNGGQFGNRWFAGGGRVISALVLSRFVSQTLRPFLVSQNQKDLLVLKEMVEAGKVMPVMDRAYSFSEIASAMGRVGGGHARGKVAITVREQDQSLTRVA